MRLSQGLADTVSVVTDVGGEIRRTAAEKLVKRGAILLDCGCSERPSDLMKMVNRQKSDVSDWSSVQRLPECAEALTSETKNSRQRCRHPNGNAGNQDGRR